MYNNTNNVLSNVLVKQYNIFKDKSYFSLASKVYKIHSFL